TPTRPWGSHERQPGVVLGVAALDDREERLLQPMRDRTGLAAPDLAMVDLADRRDLGGGAREEHLVGDVQLVARDRRLDDLDALLAEQRDRGLARDPGEDRRGG